MLTSYKDVTIKSLIFNKKRSVFTLVGIILSIMLITAFSNFSASIKQTAIENIKLESGKWHLSFHDADNNLKQGVKGNPKVDEYVFIKEYMIAKQKGMGIDIKWFDGNLNYGEPIKLKQGVLPENDKEIVVDDCAIERINKDIKIGETIEFKDSENNKNVKFKLVGILSGYPNSKFATAYSKKDIMLEKNNFLYVKFKENSKLSDTINEFKSLEKNGEKVSSNKPLLDFLGVKGYTVTSKAIDAVTASVISIIILAAISIIYNAFNITVVQRTKEFGVFRMLGCTPKQIKKLVLREATILGIMAIPLGILLGILSLKIVILILNNMTSGIRNFIGTGNVEAVISYKAIILSAVIGLLTVYISVLLPTKLASRISPLVAVSGGRFIKKEKIKKTKGFIAKRLLKVEGLIAYKNLKRNRKRYRITVFSMIISMILVISFTAGMKAIVSLMEKKDNLSRSIDIITYIDEENKGSYHSISDKIKALDGVEEVYSEYITPEYSVIIDKDKVNSSFLDCTGTNKRDYYKFNNKSVENIRGIISVYERKEVNLCSSKLLKGNIDFDGMEKKDGIIVINKGTFKKDKKRYNGNITDLKVGDEVFINFNGEIGRSVKKISDDGESGEYRRISETITPKNIKSNEAYKLNVLAVIDDSPFDIEEGGVKIIMTPKTANSINQKVIAMKSKDNKFSKEYLNTIPSAINVVLNDRNKTEVMNNKIKEVLSQNNVLGVNVDLAKKNASEKNMLIQIKVLFYGFVSVIALIAAVNIINIINTNVTLRLKELACLMSLGMSSERIRKIIFLEGAFYGIVSAFWGGIIGTIISYKIGTIINKGSSFMSVVPWITIIIVALISILIGILAALPGLFRLKKVNIIETIKMEA